MTLRRFLVAFTAVFAGALAIEVLNYHTIATIAKDRWAMAPQLSGTLLVSAALLVLAWPQRRSIMFLIASSGLSIVVGLAGIVFHFASRGVPLVNVGAVTSWLGNPPPLAPLEFAVVGTLGLMAALWERGGPLALAQIPSIASVCYGIGAILGVIAVILAATTTLAPATICVIAALVIGALGYVVEVTRPGRVTRPNGRG